MAHDFCHSGNTLCASFLNARLQTSRGRVDFRREPFYEPHQWRTAKPIPFVVKVEASMAGHSQFKNIMHRKGRQDKARSKLFSKLAKEITVAAKMGVPDPDMNPRLRLAVQNAKGQSMPKDNIERAIKKSQAGEGDDYEEIRYEGYGPGGIAVVVEALTDNRNRSPPAPCAPISPKWRLAGRNRLGLLHVRPGRRDRLPARGGRCRHGDGSGHRRGRRRCRSPMKTATPFTCAFEDMGAVSKRARNDARRGRIRQPDLEAAEHHRIGSRRQGRLAVAPASIRWKIQR
jgi:hypothetical protein